MELNLKCGDCKKTYDYEVGQIEEDEEFNLVFERETICPYCGAKNKDLLSEHGQMQVTAWYFSK